LGGKAVLTLVSVAILALTWYSWEFINGATKGITTTDVFADTGVQVKPLDGAIDILLVGQDSRTDAQGNPLPREVLDLLHAGISDGERQTDTMILVHIPQSGRKATAISFPRDSLVEINGGFGRHKLNSAYVYAYNDTSQALQQQGMSDLKEVDRQAKEAGRRNLIRTLEQFVGKPGMIDRYAEVNLASFYEITKAIGGVEVCLNHAVKETKSGVDLPAGLQRIEDVQALAFVRQRYGLLNGDLDRIARQQAFLSGLANRVLSTDMLTSPSKIAGLVAAVKKSVVLSSGWDLVAFAEQMRGLTGGNIEFHTIPTQGNAVIDGADVIRVDPAEVRSAVDGLTSDKTPNAAPTSGGTPSQQNQTLPGANAVTVDLFDGSGTTTLTPRARDLLRGKGFGIGSDTKLATRSSTVIRYAPGDDIGAALVKQTLGGSLQAEPDTEVANGHVRVLLGTDYTVPAASSSPAPSPAVQPITAGGVPCVD
jgi:LCP family protein required for cell wall assembly